MSDKNDVLMSHAKDDVNHNEHCKRNINYNDSLKNKKDFKDTDFYEYSYDIYPICLIFDKAYTIISKELHK